MNSQKETLGGYLLFLLEHLEKNDIPSQRTITSTILDFKSISYIYTINSQYHFIN